MAGGAFIELSGAPEHALRGGTKKASDSKTCLNRLHTHTRSPKRLPHPRSPMPPLSTLTARTTHARPLHPAALASVPYGLVEVILADEKMRECVLKKHVGRTLNSWVARFDDLAERKEYVREMSAKAAACASYGTPVGPLGAEGGSPGD